MTLVLLPAVRQLELLRSREISVLELADAHIRQIERLNPKLNAFADFDADRVRAQARTHRMRRQTPRGPLHGLPVTVKSSIATAGYRCEIGSLLHQGDIPARRRRRRRATARGRSADSGHHQLPGVPDGLRDRRTCCTAPRAIHGTLTARRADRAAASRRPSPPGMSAAGLGSDSGGSVRVPAHFTGICSLKPTPGRIPGAAICRHASDRFRSSAPSAPWRAPSPTSLFCSARSAARTRTIRSARRCRCATPSLDELRTHTIGFFEDDGLVPVTPETRAAVNAAAQALRDAGFRVEPFRPRTLEQLRKLWWTFFVQCGAMFYEPEIRGKRDRLSPIFREFLAIAEAVRPLTATELLNAWAELDLLRAKTLEEMSDYPVLLCPVASIPAFRHGERTWTIDGQPVAYLDAVRHTQWFNALAAPAAVVPVGRSPEGLPIGVQIVARPFEDEIALGIAAVVDSAFGYRPPPLALAP